jgi:hypothetical protein
MAKTSNRGALAATAGTLMAVGLVVLMLVDVRPAGATFPGKPGKIAYEGLDAPNGDYEIYTINPGGGSKVQLTDNATGDTEPSYSPSGKKIAYSGKEEPNGTGRSTPSTPPAEEVRSKLPTTLR